MGKYGLAYPIRKANPYRRMAKAMKSDAIAANLLNREFEKYGPRKVLLTDISYIPCCGKFFYLSVIKDEVGAALSLATSFEDAKAMLDDWMDYYNTDRGQWQLAKLSPNEFFDYYTTGIYPLVLSPSSTQPHVE